MKRLSLYILSAAIVCFSVSCNGDHTPHSNIDTVKNRYGSANDTKNARKNIDTSRITTKTGDASSIDNSASGGADITKDTAKQKPPKKSK